MLDSVSSKTSCRLLLTTLSVSVQVPSPPPGLQGGSGGPPWKLGGRVSPTPGPRSAPGGIDSVPHCDPESLSTLPSARTSHDTTRPLKQGNGHSSSMISSFTTPKSSSIDLKKNL